MSENSSPTPNLARCSCNNCSGHLEFDPAYAGSTVQCPRCGKKTFLFVPPMSAASPPKRAQRNWGKFIGFEPAAAFAAFFFLGIFFLSCAKNESPQPKPPVGTNAPVEGLFGWKLGDKLPPNVGVRTNESDFILEVSFTPEKPIPPFEFYTLYITSDRRIFKIEAMGNAHDSTEANRFKDSLVEVLTGKYGLERHLGSKGEWENYYFGTGGREVDLKILPSRYSTATLFTLTCSDGALAGQAYTESKQREAEAKREMKTKLEDSLKGL